MIRKEVVVTTVAVVTVRRLHEVWMFALDPDRVSLHETYGRSSKGRSR